MSRGPADRVVATATGRRGSFREPLLDRAGTRCDAQPSAGRGNRAAPATLKPRWSLLASRGFVTLIGAARTRLAKTPRLPPAGRGRYHGKRKGPWAGAARSYVGPGLQPRLTELGRRARNACQSGRWAASGECVLPADCERRERQRQTRNDEARRSQGAAREEFLRGVEPEARWNTLAWRRDDCEAGL